MSTSKEFIDAIAALKAAGEETDFPGPLKLLEERLLKAIQEGEEAQEQFGNTTEVQL